MNYNQYYKQVYSRDNPEGENYGWIQWKGTDVCIDLHCSCGYHGHVDGDFFYHYECVGCGKKYTVGQNVKLIPLTEEEAQFIEDGGGTGFIRDEDHSLSEKI